jgi:hypothetical protein
MGVLWWLGMMATPWKMAAVKVKLALAIVLLISFPQ